MRISKSSQCSSILRITAVATVRDRVIDVANGAPAKYRQIDHAKPRKCSIAASAGVVGRVSRRLAVLHVGAGTLADDFPSLLNAQLTDRLSVLKNYA